MIWIKLITFTHIVSILSIYNMYYIVNNKKNNLKIADNITTQYKLIINVVIIIFKLKKKKCGF